MTDTNPLPPLPEPEGVIVVGTQALRAFTAYQMRTYALQARAQVHPAQATQAEVTDERQAFEQWYAALPNNGRKAGLTLLDAWQARAILALRPAAVPMRPASRDVIMATRTANADAEEWPEPWAYQRGWNNAEAHHGLTVKSNKETT